MTTGLKAIETRYAGHLFRSRLEARWAVALDVLGVGWEYEKEGYDLGDAGYYLPDFWLPSLKCWIEIKGQQPTDEEDKKAEMLAKIGGHDVFIFTCGFPVTDYLEDVRCASDGCSGAYRWFCDEGWDNFYRWCVCPDCGSVGIQFDGRSDRLPCKECYLCWIAREKPQHYPEGCEHHGVGAITGCPRHSFNGDKTYTPGHPRITTAFDKARSARFEYGESGSRR